MRITFDSNAWERIFDPNDREYEPIRRALISGEINGFICDSALRIEAIRKIERNYYFIKPQMDVRMRVSSGADGKICLVSSIGPADENHPGLPDIQAEKLKIALAHGVQMIRGICWLGLPQPNEILDQRIYAQEAEVERTHREQRQLDAYCAIKDRGVGRVFFEELGGWTGRPIPAENARQFQRACAEWADGELVQAHIAYENDVICTNDRAQNAGASIFDAGNRAWLADNYGVRFMTVEELVKEVSQ